VAYSVFPKASARCIALAVLGLRLYSVYYGNSKRYSIHQAPIAGMKDCLNKP
jgi:hypothetical protein